MSASGTWDVTMLHPAFGERPLVAVLVQEGDGLTGTLQGTANVDITDGAVAGDDVSWNVVLTAPFPMLMEWRGTIAGDSISGLVGMGTNGTASFTGARRAG